MAIATRRCGGRDRRVPSSATWASPPPPSRSTGCCARAGANSSRGRRAASVDAAPAGAAGEVRGRQALRDQVRVRAGGRPADRDRRTGRGRQAPRAHQVLLGVTGSGKTFTMAKVIEATQRPALILAPNKTLAAQLYGEFKSFFPDNAVEYFVSYYDYYQPEAYVPRTDTYIEKESSINEQIDRMRHSATRAMLERDDVIIVASVSCIYGIGSVETYSAMTVHAQARRAHRPAPADRRPGGAAIQAQRRRFRARHLPGARRHDRHLPGALRRPRLAGRPVRRRGGERSPSSIRSPARRPASSTRSRSTPTRTM